MGHSYLNMVNAVDERPYNQPVIVRSDIRTIGDMQTSIVCIRRRQDDKIHSHVRIRFNGKDDEHTSFQLDQMIINSTDDWDIFNKLVRSQFSVKAAPYVFARYVGPRNHGHNEVLKIDPIYSPRSNAGSWATNANCQLFGYKSDYDWVSFEWRDNHPLILCRCVDQWGDGIITLKPVCNVSKIIAKLLMYMEWELACKPIGERRVGLLHGNYPFMFYSKKGKDDLMASIDHKKLESMNYVGLFNNIRRSNRSAFFWLRYLKQNVIRKGE